MLALLTAISLSQVAHSALLNLLKTNLDLLPAVIDRCYLKDASVSNLYFHVRPLRCRALHCIAFPEVAVLCGV